MTTSISEHARAFVAETLPLMEQHRVSLEEAIERYMSHQRPDGLATGAARAATSELMDMLLGHARQSGSSAGIPAMANRHRALGLGSEQYSCFGDALKPVMRDVLGTRATSPVLVAWTDAYWAAVRRLFQQESRLAA